MVCGHMFSGSVHVAQTYYYVVFVMSHRIRGPAFLFGDVTDLFKLCMYLTPRQLSHQSDRLIFQTV